MSPTEATTPKPRNSSWKRIGSWLLLIAAYYLLSLLKTLHLDQRVYAFLHITSKVGQAFVGGLVIVPVLALLVWAILWAPRKQRKTERAKT